ncbi:MAG: MFS transporter, partial [Corynebacterium variabile]
RANARLMITGHIGGSMVVGAAAAAVAFVFSPKEALWLLLLCALVGIYLCGLIPSTAESSGDEIFADPFAPTDDLGPAMGAPDGEEAPTVVAPIASSASSSLIGRWRRSMSVRFPDATRTAMWGTAMQRLGTGFMTIYVAFVAKSSHTLSGAEQLALLGVVGAAGGVGTFLGNAVGSRVKFSRPRFTVIMLAVVSLASVVVAAVVDGVPTAAVATLLLSLGSAISKSCLDATIQSGLNPSAQASAFGLSETTLQLSWVLGGTLGLLLPTELTVGMAVLAATGTVFFVNVILASRGLGVGSLIGRARSRS